MTDTAAQAAVGVFDSGVGGLSVLRALREALPHERFIYLADNAHGPYGERGDAFVGARALAVSRHLREQHGVKALVVACNTATAAGMHLLRAHYPALPLVGVEPAIKPAVALSRTGRVGVLATRGTLQSGKFRALLATLQGQADFTLQACDGLAAAIERSAAHGDEADAAALAAHYMAQAGRFGKGRSEMDTLVLGCTHYPLLRERFEALAGSAAQVVDTGAAVARQTQRLLDMHGLLAPAPGKLADGETGTPQVQLLCTGDTAPLQAAARRWLALAQLPARTNA